MKINLIKDLIYHNDEDFFYQYDKIVSDCDLPFRESFRTRKRRERDWETSYYRAGQRVEDITVWKYADMIIRNNIGKSFEQCFSYYCKKTRGVLYAQYTFLEDFRGRFSDFYIDEEGNIQGTEYSQYWKRKRLNKVPWSKDKGFHRKYWENRDQEKKKRREEKRAYKNKVYSLKPSFLTEESKELIKSRL